MSAVVARVQQGRIRLEGLRAQVRARAPPLTARARRDVHPRGGGERSHRIPSAYRRRLRRRGHGGRRRPRPVPGDGAPGRRDARHLRGARAERAGDRAKLLPDGFDAWFARTLRKNAAERWPSAGEAAAAFAALVVRGAGSAATPATEPFGLTRANEVGTEQSRIARGDATVVMRQAADASVWPTKKETREANCVGAVTSASPFTAGRADYPRMTKRPSSSFSAPQRVFCRERLELRSSSGDGHRPDASVPRTRALLQHTVRSRALRAPLLF